MRARRQAKTRVDEQCRESEAAGRLGGRAETSLHYKAKSPIRLW